MGNAAQSSTHEHPLEVAPSPQQVMLGWIPQTDTGTGPAQHQNNPKPTGHAAAAGWDGWGNPASSLAAGASLNLHGKSQGFPCANSPALRREHPILPLLDTCNVSELKITSAFEK